MYILTEYHMRSDNMSAENRLLIAALKMSQNLSCGAKRSPGLWSHITMPSESLEKILVADMIAELPSYDQKWVWDAPNIRLTVMHTNNSA